MSQLFISLDGYDVMDQVFVSVRVRSTSEDRTEAIATLLHYTTTVPGAGETDPRRWAADALVAALEAL